MIKLLKNFRWYYWLLVLIIMVLVYIQVSADLELPDHLSQILYLSMNLNDPTAKKQITEHGLQMLMYAGISMTCTIVVGFMAAKIAAGFSHDIRKKIYRKVQNFSMEEIDKFSTSSLITRSTNDVTQVQMVVVMVLRIAISAPIMAIKAISKASGKADQLTFIVAIAVITLVLIVVSIFMTISPKFKKMQKLTDRLNLVTRENLTGLRVVRAYGATDIEQEKFEEANVEITKTNVFVNRVVSLMNPGMMLTMSGASLAILWIGAYIVQREELPLADVFSFQQYTMQIVMAFMQLTMIFIMVPRGSVSGSRINEVLETKTAIEDPIQPVKESDEKGIIEFKNVWFTYPGATESVLENVSFKINSGETVAFIGSTGSGKSTLINLIPRFFDATSGEVLVDGINVKDYNQKDLRDKLGYIPQKGVLFSGTIASNLEFGLNNATVEEMNDAIEIAQAKDFVSKLAEGLEYPIAQGGTNVSGGQKQRLSIARAIIKNPEIFIFDDSFSALDFKTDKVLRAALNEKIKDATKVIVAQRIGTILNANQIVVLDKGKVVGIGTHKELLQNCEVYQEIASSQLTKEELENA